MSVSALKRKFYKIYNRNYELINKLENKNSFGKNILFMSHLLLDDYFNNYDKPTFYKGIINYLSDENKLIQTIIFFEERINIISDLYKKYNEDKFEKLVPYLFFICNYNEMYQKYLSELKEKKLDEKVLNIIKNLNKNIEDCIFITEDEFNNLNSKYFSFSKFVDINALLSCEIISVYEDYIYTKDGSEDFNEDKLKKILDCKNTDPLLSKLRAQYSLIIKTINQVHGSRIFKLKRNSRIYDLINKLRDFTDLLLFTTEDYKGSMEKLSNELGFDFAMISLVVFNIYFETVNLLNPEYDYINIESCTKEKFNLYEKYIVLMALLSILESTEDNDIVEELSELRNDIIEVIHYEEELNDEIEELFNVHEVNFLNECGSKYDSVETLLKDVYHKLSKIME